MMQTGKIPLHYHSNEYKFQQMILVSTSEKCAITQSTIKELYEENMKRGVPHILALVHCEGRGQNVYDASALSESIARNKRWEWKNPATNEKIKRIDFFAINHLDDGYQLLKKNKVNKIGNGQVYEDLWFCSNMAFATQSDNPYAFHSISAMIRHFNNIKDYKQVAKWRYNCYKCIENHYGKGIAIIFMSGRILKSGLIPFMGNFLFMDFKYKCFDDLFAGSKLDELISKLKEDFFDKKNEDECYKDECYKQVKKLFYDILKEKSDLPGVRFAEYLFKSFEDGGISLVELESFVLDEHLEVAHLAQAALCTFGDIFVEKYIENLTKLHPDWQLGQALLINNNMKNLQDNELIKKLKELEGLSRDTRDLLLLQLLAERFDEFNVASSIWSSSENICMKILSISRFQEKASGIYIKAIKKVNEIDNALFIQKNNFDIFSNYSSLADLSDLKREISIKNNDKVSYLEGVQNGLTVYTNRSQHNRLMFPLAQDLVAEITPFKSNNEHENMGVQILKQEFQMNPAHNLIKKILGDYLIRRGSEIEARNAQKWIEELKLKFPKDKDLDLSLIRAQLRFAEKRENLSIVEEMIRECEKSGISPTLYLLKALWQSHPLRRDTLPEWYILASVNFKKAFENADSLHVQFLLDHLSRYDKLTEEDQLKCRTTILELLGVS